MCRYDARYVFVQGAVNAESPESAGEWCKCIVTLWRRSFVLIPITSTVPSCHHSKPATPHHLAPLFLSSTSTAFARAYKRTDTHPGCLFSHSLQPHSDLVRFSSSFVSPLPLHSLPLPGQLSRSPLPTGATLVSVPSAPPLPLLQTCLEPLLPPVPLFRASSRSGAYPRPNLCPSSSSTTL